MALVDDAPAGSTLRLLEVVGTVLRERARAPLPASAADRVLELTAFDDEVVAVVGEAQVSAPRGSSRTGASALVVGGDGRIFSLDVGAIDAYRLAFRSSRYDDFPAQIATAQGIIEAQPVDAFGAPAAAVADLLARTGATIAAVMRPEASAEARERLFETWASERALLFRQSSDRLSMTRTVEAGGTTLFVIEGPEPLALSRDVTIALSRRSTAGPLPSGPVGPGAEAGGVIEAGSRRGAPPMDEFAFAPRASARSVLAWLDAFEWADGRLVGPPLPRGLEIARRIVTVEAVRALRQRVEYRIEPGPGGPGGRGSVEAILDRRRPDHAFVLPRLEPGEVVLVGSGGALLPPVRPPSRWPPRPIVFVPQRLVALTNGDETRALLIPVDAAGVAVSLPGGRYRFSFAIDRPRWRTDVPDTISNYRAEASVDAEW